MRRKKKLKESKGEPRKKRKLKMQNQIEEGKSYTDRRTNNGSNWGKKENREKKKREKKEKKIRKEKEKREKTKKEKRVKKRKESSVNCDTHFWKSLSSISLKVL